MKDVFNSNIQHDADYVYSRHSFQHFMGIGRISQAVANVVDGDDGLKKDSGWEKTVSNYCMFCPCC